VRDRWRSILPLAGTPPAAPTAWRLSLLTGVLGMFSLYGLQQGLVRGKMRRAGLAERTTTLDNGTVHYWVGGQGPPLLLVHGFGGDAAWAWHEQVRQLAARRTLYIPDLLFFGSSWSELGNFSVEFQAETLLQLLDEHGVDRVDVGGISYGGLVAFALAAHESGRVRRLVLVDSPGPTYTDTDHEEMLARFDIASVAELLLPEEPRGVRRLIEVAWYNPPPTPSFVLSDVHRQMFRVGVEQKRAMLHELEGKRAELRERDWSVHQPTLVVWGEHDPVFPIEVGQRLADALPDSEFMVLEGTCHAPNLEKPVPFNEAVLSFLRR
jgi:pimeloyl-ACP methyl ester carboxylesterase